MDQNSIALIVGSVVAIILAFLARENGKKVGKREGVEVGKKQAVSEMKAQSTEQTLERVISATEARTAVERTPDRELSDQTRRDPNNRLRGV